MNEILTDEFIELTALKYLVLKNFMNDAGFEFVFTFEEFLNKQIETIEQKLRDGGIIQ